MPSGFLNNLGPAQAGAAAGVQNYRQFMQASADINDLIAADRYNREFLAAQTGAPSAVVAPQREMFTAPAGLVGPNYQNPNALLPPIPVPGYAPGGGAASAGAGVAGAQPSPAAGLQRGALNIPGDWNQSVPAPLGVREKQGYQITPPANIVPTGPDKPLLQNAAGTLVNTAASVTGSLNDLGVNFIQRPFVNAANLLTSTPQPLGGPTNPVGQYPSADAMRMFAGNGASAPAAASTGSMGGPPAASPTAPGGSATPSPAIAGGATPGAAGDYSTATTVGMAQTGSPAQAAMAQKRLMQQRTQLEQMINAQLSSIYEQQDRTVQANQKRVADVTSRLEIARRAGNVAAMETFYGQIDAINQETEQVINETDGAADQLRIQGQTMFEQNTQQLWSAEVDIASSEFVHARNPARIEQILSAFEGRTVRIQPTEDGRWAINDFMNGQQTRRNKLLTSDEVIDQVLMRVDAEFRQSSLASKDAAAKSGLEFQRELAKLSTEKALDLQNKIIEKNMDLAEVTVTTVTDQNGRPVALIMPKGGPDYGQPFYFDLGDVEIPGAAGLKTAKGVYPLQTH